MFEGIIVLILVAIIVCSFFIGYWLGEIHQINENLNDLDNIQDLYHDYEDSVNEIIADLKDMNRSQKIMLHKIKNIVLGSTKDSGTMVFEIAQLFGKEE